MAFSPFAALVESASIHTPKAINIVASRVAFYPGDTYVSPKPSIPSNGLDLPPKALMPDTCAAFVEYGGHRRGRIMALRFWGYDGKGEAVFLMRCDCGRYAFRKIVQWASKGQHSDNCGVCEKVVSLSHRNQRRDRSRLRRAAWITSMLGAGLTVAQCDMIEKYSLNTNDLQWLKGALAEIEARKVGGC